ncbi:MAG: hypothetical protein HQM09_17170 [Candidatus Riflebacteria bacterium]|nr:hypothetical protein [Candidatus Riflebacteria bacterium]
MTRNDPQIAISERQSRYLSLDLRYTRILLAVWKTLAIHAIFLVFPAMVSAVTPVASRTLRIQLLLENLHRLSGTPGSSQTTLIPFPAPGNEIYRSVATGSAGLLGSVAEVIDDGALNEIPGQVKPVVLAHFPMAVYSGGVRNPVNQACSFQGWNDKIMFLDSQKGVIFTSADARSLPDSYVTDEPRHLLRMSDFAMISSERLAIADNTRQSVFIFRDRRFEKAITEIDGRALFRNILYIWAEKNGNRLGVYDSGRDRTLVFDVGGNLLAERPGKFEPLFWRQRLIQLKKEERGVSVHSVDPVTGKDNVIFSYVSPSGRLLLDAWGAGALGDEFVIVVYEGAQDEDHPAGGRALRFSQAGPLETVIRMTFDMELGLRRHFSLLAREGRIYLLEAHPTDEETSILGYQLH